MKEESFHDTAHIIFNQMALAISGLSFTLPWVEYIIMNLRAHRITMMIDC